MRKVITAASIALAAVVAGGELSGTRASGPLGIFGVIERIQFYPDEAHAERVQMFGVFVYHACPTEGIFEMNGIPRGALTDPRRGYMYFALPQRAISDEALVRTHEQARREWQYVKSVTGTGQAVGFGSGLCGFTGRGGSRELVPDGRHLGIRVRMDSEPLSAPAEYPINIGVVPLSPGGTNADIVRQLEAARGK